MDNGRGRLSNDLSFSLNFNNKSLDYISPIRKKSKIHQLSNSTLEINPMHTLNDKMTLQKFNPKNFRQKQFNSNSEIDSYDYTDSYYYSSSDEYSSSDPLKTTLTTTGADDLPTVHFDSSDFSDNSSISSYMDSRTQKEPTIQQTNLESESSTNSQIPVFRFSFNSSSSANSKTTKKKEKKPRDVTSLRYRKFDDRADAGSKASSKHGKAPPLREDIDIDTTTTTTTTTSAFNTPAPLFIPDLDTPSDIDLLRGRYDFHFPRTHHQNKTAAPTTNKEPKKGKKKKSKQKTTNNAKSTATNNNKQTAKKDRKPPPLYIDENKKDSSSTRSRPKYETPLQKAVEEFRQAAIKEKERQKMIDEQKNRQRELIRQNQQNRKNDIQDKKQPTFNSKQIQFENRKPDAHSYKNEINPKLFHSNDNSIKNPNNIDDEKESLLSERNLKISKGPKSAEYAHIPIQPQETTTRKKGKSKRFRPQEPPIVIFGSLDDSTTQTDNNTHHEQLIQSPVSTASSITTLKTKEALIPVESISTTTSSSSTYHRDQNDEEKVPLNRSSNPALSRLIESTESTYQDDTVSYSLSSLHPSRKTTKVLADREEVIPPDEFNKFTNDADSHKTPSLTNSLQPLDSSDVLSNKDMLNEEETNSQETHSSNTFSYEPAEDEENASPFKFQRPSKYMSETEFSTTHTDISLNSRLSLSQNSTQHTNKATVDDVEVIDSDSSNPFQDKSVHYSNEPENDSHESTQKSTIDINDFLRTVKERKNQSQTVEPIVKKKKKRSNAHSTLSSINTNSLANDSDDKNSISASSRQSAQNDYSYSSQYSKYSNSDSRQKSSDNHASNQQSYSDEHNTADQTPISYIESLTSDYNPPNKVPQVVEQKPKKKKRPPRKKHSSSKKQAIHPQELPTVVLTTQLDENKNNEFRFDRYICTQPTYNKNQLIPYKEDFYPSIENPREPIRGWFKFQVNLIPHPDTFDMEQKASGQYSFEKLLKQLRTSE